MGQIVWNIVVLSQTMMVAERIIDRIEIFNVIEFREIVMSGLRNNVDNFLNSGEKVRAVNIFV